MLKITPLLIAALLFLIFPTHDLTAQQQEWLSYEPMVVELKGKLLRVVKYGPPNYGENPESDARYEIPILLLAEPIRIKGDPTDWYKKESLTNVSFVQLIFSKAPSFPYWRYAYQDIVVRGTLFRAVTGHHYTDVLVDVTTIRTAKK